jgi:hypothetical protein
MVLEIADESGWAFVSKSLGRKLAGEGAQALSLPREDRNQSTPGHAQNKKDAQASCHGMVNDGQNNCRRLNDLLALAA